MVGTNEREPDMNSPAQERLDLYLDLDLMVPGLVPDFVLVLDSEMDLDFVLLDQ